MSDHRLPLRPKDHDTICAQATPPGVGALALVRISGPKALKICKSLLPFFPSRPLSHHLYFGTALYPQNKKPIDEVLVSFFQKGKSFTGEESLEISCHGGEWIVAQIIEGLLWQGCRMAEPGEFSYRAFIHGNIDLLQAESILDLIQSQTPLSHRQALKSLKGSLSLKVKKMEEKLTRLLAHLEASLDFSEEDIQPFSLSEQKKQIKEMKEQALQWVKSFKQGEMIRKGFCVVFSGAPNAGKSSLFNDLIEEDRVITSSQAGTTRDVVSARWVLHQREFCFKDTAGFGKKTTGLQAQATKKTLQAVESADLNVFLVESRWPLKTDSFFQIKKVCARPPFLLVFSKADLLSSRKRDLFLKGLRKFIPSQDIKSPLWLSLKTREGVKVLKEKILDISKNTQTHQSVLFTSRQMEKMKKIHTCFHRAFSLAGRFPASELIACELKEALRELYELSGKEYGEEVITKVFQEFCIGK